MPTAASPQTEKTITSFFPNGALGRWPCPKKSASPMAGPHLPPFFYIRLSTFGCANELHKLKAKHMFTCQPDIFNIAQKANDALR